MSILERLAEILHDVKLPFVMEFGACDGYHSNLMLQVIKSKQRPYIFHTFEPVADLHRSIINNLGYHLMHNNGVIGIFPNAIGATNGIVELHKSHGVKLEKGQIVDRYYGSSSIRKPTNVLHEYWPSMKFETEEVVCVSLDAHLTTHGLSSKIIDFIWCDIQGADKDLIAGGRQAFNNVRYFYTEYMTNEQYEGQLIGVDALLELLPSFEVVEDYNGDVLLRNRLLK